MIKILITGAGYLGCNTLIKEIKKLDDRFYFIGIDRNPNSAAKLYCDVFYPHNSLEDLEHALLKEKPDLILPGSSYAIPQKGEIKNISSAIIMRASSQIVGVCLSKTETYKSLKGHLDLPQYIVNDNGYYYKPVFGKGSRDLNYYNGRLMFFMESLLGEELDIDVLSWKGELLLAMCKTRNRTYGGTAVEMELVDRPEIIKQIKKALKILSLDYLSVWQFIGGKLLEINPRIAGAVFYPEGWNMPYLAIKLALGEIEPEEIKQYQDRIPYGRRMWRYLEQYEK